MASVGARFVLAFGYPSPPMSYEEFLAWAAYFHHASLHEEDEANEARLQAEHDAVLAGAARASRG